MDFTDQSLEQARRARKWIARAWAIWSIAALAAVVAALLWFGLIDWYAMSAMIIGGVVGAVEILGRYRHSPVRAVLTWSGFSYILINIAAAWAAYYMLGVFQVFSPHPSAEAQDLLERVLTAGFGSLVFLRSSFFKVRVGDSDIGIGPAAILDTLLLVADHGVDRREAVARAQDVTELMSHVRDPRVVAKMLTKYCLALMQNVDDKTSQDLADAVGKIMSDGDIPDAIKMDIVALRLGIVVGPDVLEAAVAALGDRLGAADTTPPPGATPLKPTAESLKAEIERGSG
jgi:hypothetical protein